MWKLKGGARTKLLRFWYSKNESAVGVVGVFTVPLLSAYSLWQCRYFVHLTLGGLKYIAFSSHIDFLIKAWRKIPAYRTYLRRPLQKRIIKKPHTELRKTTATPRSVMENATAPPSSAETPLNRGRSAYLWIKPYSRFAADRPYRARISNYSLSGAGKLARIELGEARLQKPGISRHL